MSGRQIQSHERRHSFDRVVINPNPRIINRSPEPPVRRASHSGPRTLFRIPNPFSRHNHTKVLVTERTLRRRRREVDEGTPCPRDSSSRGRQPDPPVFINPTRSQSTPPTAIYSKMPTQGQREYVPLPPRIPSDEDKHSSRERSSREREKVRDSRQSRRSQAVEEPAQIIEESGFGRRSPRPYHHHQKSDPFDAQEQILEPPSPRIRTVTPNFEVVQPNETVRSRQRDNEVVNQKEYVRMKQLAEHNFKVAEKAAERFSSAEVRLQNLQKQLADSEKQLYEEKYQHSKTAQREEDLRKDNERLRNDTDRLLRQLEDLRIEHRIADREREVSDHQTKLIKDQLNLQRQLAEERERDASREKNKQKERSRSKERETRDSSGAEGGHRRRRRIVRLHDSRDAEPRILRRGEEGTDALSQARAEASKTTRTADPRDTGHSRNLLGGNGGTSRDAGEDALTRARREAHREKDTRA